MALSNLGYLALEDGDLDTAGARFAEAVQLARTRGDLRSQAFFLENLAMARLGQGDEAHARDSLVASLRIAQRLGFLEVVATNLVGAAAIAAAREPARAAVLLGGTEQLLGRTGGGLDSGEARLREATAAEIMRRIGVASFEFGLAEGRSSDDDDLVELALDSLIAGDDDPLGRGQQDP
jgi:ATP/maltotriose-dependent transcriptional regulator MalT